MRKANWRRWQKWLQFEQNLPQTKTEFLVSLMKLELSITQSLKEYTIKLLQPIQTQIKVQSAIFQVQQPADTVMEIGLAVQEATSQL